MPAGRAARARGAGAARQQRGLRFPRRAVILVGQAARRDSRHLQYQLSLPVFAMGRCLMLLWLLADSCGHPVQQYVARWNASIASADNVAIGAFSGSPYLGNGDLGVSIAANVSTGEITLYLGLNQLWGLRTNYSANASFLPPSPAFPRRLGLGKVVISIPQLPLGNVLRAAFRAEQHISSGVVNMLMSLSGTTLSVRVYLAPDENTMVAELSSDSPVDVEVSTSVLALQALWTSKSGACFLRRSSISRLRSI
jgi:hypothetical protein